MTPGPQVSPLDVLFQAANVLALDPAQCQRLVELASVLQATNQSAGPEALDAAVERAIAQRLKDSKIVEIEIAQAVAERLLAWAKTFAPLVGLPLALLAVILGVLGINSWSDFSGTVAQSKRDIQAKITVATTSAAKLDTQARQLDGQYTDLKQKFGDVSRLASEVEGLSGKVNAIEEQIEFKNMPATGPASAAVIRRKLGGYGIYLRLPGYVPKSKLQFEISPTDQMNAAFDGGKIIVSLPVAAADDILFRMYTERAQNELRPDYWDSAINGVAAIGSGIADYLPASYLGEPAFGRAFVAAYGKKLPAYVVSGDALRNLVNARPFGDPKSDAYEMHTEGEAWGGVFWTLRTALGCTKAPRCPAADRIALKAWVEVPFAATSIYYQRVGRYLIDAARATGGNKAAEQVRADLRRRCLVI